MGSARPKSPSRASSRSFYTACGSTGPSSTGRQRRLPRNAHKEIIEFPQYSAKRRPCRDVGGGEIARFLACARKGDRAFNIDPPTSSYAIMRGLAPTAERTVGPARIVEESLTPRPGIREQNRPKADIQRFCSSRRGLPWLFDPTRPESVPPKNSSRARIEEKNSP